MVTGVIVLVILVLGAGAQAAMTPQSWHDFIDCAPEGEFCPCSGTVRYGTHDAAVDKFVQGGVLCCDNAFDDPPPLADKFCRCWESAEAPVTYLVDAVTDVIIDEPEVQLNFKKSPRWLVLVSADCISGHENTEVRKQKGWLPPVPPRS